MKYWAIPDKNQTWGVEDMEFPGELKKYLASGITIRG